MTRRVAAQRFGPHRHVAVTINVVRLRRMWRMRDLAIIAWGALGAGPVSADYLDKPQLRGISLEHIRRDRILHEALTTGADPLHPALVFNIDHANAMAYPNAARHLLSVPVEGADAAVL